MQTSESTQTTATETKSLESTSLPVACFSTYVAEPSLQADRHRDVRNFLLALRGEQVSGTSAIPVGSDERSLTTMNANDSIDWFGEMVVQYLDSNKSAPPFGLVPVPTPQTTLASNAGPWTSLLAISIASNGLEDSSVLDLLRWQEPLAEQRCETVSELYENLAVIRPFPSDRALVLVDYLFSSSTMLRACAARLRSHGANVVLGLCAGRTAKEAAYDPFTVVTGQLQRYRPGH